MFLLICTLWNKQNKGESENERAREREGKLRKRERGCSKNTGEQ